MKKQEYVDQIDTMLGEINQLMTDYCRIVYHIKDSTLKRSLIILPSYFDIFKYEDIKDCHKWVKNIHEHYYTPLKYKLDQFGVETIKRMMDLGFNETFEEIELLNTLFKALKKSISKKHRIFTKQYLKDNNIKIKKERGL